MKVVFSQAARRDLEQIGDYIARDNPVRARTFIAELRAVAIALADTPKAYPLVPRYERFGIRRRAFGRYLIFYRIHHERVAIVHILHGARDYEELLFPEPLFGMAVGQPPPRR